MADRPAKLQRLERFRRSQPNMSMSALASVLKDVRDNGIPELSSRSQQREARSMAMKVQTPYGALIRERELSDGRVAIQTKLVLVHFWALLDIAFRECAGWRELIIKQDRSSPSSIERPWSLIIYGDEVEPGHALAARNARKSWGVYVSFLEFGPLVLSDELAWFTLTIFRAHELKGAAAGVSQMFREILKDIFKGPVDPTTSGVVLGDSSGVHVRVYCKLGVFIMDGDAHRAVWCCKGDAGLKLCMLHANLYTSKSGIVQEDGTEMLTCSLVRDEDAILCSDEDVRGSVDRLAAKHATDAIAVFKKREQVVGFRHEPEGILLCEELRDTVKPASQFCHDTQHTLFVNGVFNTIVYLFFETLWLGDMKGVYEAADDYLAGWEWPNQYKCEKGIREFFSKPS